MSDAEDERIARQRVEAAIDRLVRAVAADGFPSRSADRAYMFVGQTLDRLVRVTREAVAQPVDAERVDDPDQPTT